MLKHDALAKKMLANTQVREAYEKQEPEYALLDELLRARRKAGLTQAQVAERMGTQAPAVARLEASLGSNKHSPSVATLQRYAKAVGKKLVIKLV
ncbi:MAG: helix-turn-helix transcriptional regulator [Desulfarculus sp.]|nr:helix-turn-helix transcriptional regulator [Desulfarculus sp.]